MGPGAECSGESERFDFDGYIDFLQERGHNLIRLWRWERGSFHLCMTPQPWARTGPGEAI